MDDSLVDDLADLAFSFFEMTGGMMYIWVTDQLGSCFATLAQADYLTPGSRGEGRRHQDVSTVISKNFKTFCGKMFHNLMSYIKSEVWHKKRGCRSIPPHITSSLNFYSAFSETGTRKSLSGS